MSRNGGSRSSPSRKGGSLLAGILIGMMLGLAIAGGVAWYILKTPNPFANKEQREAVRLAPDGAKPAPAKTAGSEVAASGVGEGKPRFEFYKVLTDKPDATVPAQKSSGKTGAAENKQGVQSAGKTLAKETYLLQAGAFANANDADKMKAKLAMLGMEASIQTVTAADKGILHRVRLGPYQGADEMNMTLATLKQNGVDATPIRVP